LYTSRPLLPKVPRDSAQYLASRSCKNVETAVEITPWRQMWRCKPSDASSTPPDDPCASDGECGFGNSIDDRSATGPPGFSQPACEALRRAVIRREPTSAQETCSRSNRLWLCDPSGLVRRNDPLDESAVKQLVTVTQLEPGCALQAARGSSDDEADPPLESQRSARLLVLGPRATPCASANPGGGDSR
jgi:hypothetical protein